MNSDGYFYLSVKKGEGEGVQKDLRYDDVEKFWSFFEEDEIAQYIQSAGFEIIDCCTVEKKSNYHTHPCVRLFCQKNKFGKI